MCCYQIRHQKQYFSDTYNFIDLVSGILSLLALMYMGTSQHSENEDVLRALAGLLRWVKVIYYLRGFGSTAPLINMLQKIVLGMRSFVAVLAVVLVG